MGRRRKLLLAAVMMGLYAVVNGRVEAAGRDELGGASAPRRIPDRPAPADGQSKRIGQWGLTLILEGQFEQALRYADEIR